MSERSETSRTQAFAAAQASADAKAVVVTRAETADGPLSSELRNLGLPVLLWPAVTTSAADTTRLYEALDHVRDFDWIVFASRHAVAAVMEKLTLPPRGVSIAAVGQATAQVLTQRGWPVDLVPHEPNAAGLVAAFESRFADSSAANARGSSAPKVLFPASSRALPTIAAGLTQLGAEVVQVEAYRTESASLDLEQCRSWIGRDRIGAVTFASPSAVIELERALGKEDFDRLLASAAAVAIGPTTARELTERGRSPVLAESATLQGLAQTAHRLCSSTVKRH
jgi:uroporphyrinogen III methyltransferase / synthase